MAWIDYKKTYGMVLYTWTLQCLKIFKVADNIRNMIEKSIKNLKVELKSVGETLDEVKIMRQFITDLVCHNFYTFVYID